MRHRIPVDAYETLQDLQQQGKLTVTKGEITHAESDGEYFLLKQNNKTLFIKSEKMVVCSGFKYQPEHLLRLIGNLLKPKDQLQKSLLNCDFTISSSYPIYALGPCLAGILFETTSIHDIRQQALRIAEAIEADI